MRNTILKVGVLIAFIILGIYLISAVDLNLQGNADFRNIWNITNVPFINSINFTLFYNNFISSNSTLHSRIDSVNSSLLSINTTLDTKINNVNSSLQTNINTVNSRVDTINSTIVNSNASWTSTYNSTYHGLINNASYLSTYNSTYDSYTTSNYSNKSNYWDNMNTINSTQMEDNSGVLNILISWLTSLFYTKSQVFNNTANIEHTNYNISANYLKGNMDWTNLTNYPVACPDGTYLTQLSDSVTCTAVHGNISIENTVVTNLNVTKNITMVNNGTICLDNICAHKIYENSTGAVIIE